MRSLVEDEEELAPVKRDREPMLGSGTVLGIFFGLVMICGLFFGLGYSVGHRSAVDAEALLEKPAQVASVAGPAAGELRAKPSAATAPEPLAEAVAEPLDESAAKGVKETAKQADADATANTENGDTSAWPPETTKVPKPTAAKVLQPGPTEKPAVAAGAGIGAGPAAVMVQIAAIGNAADADVLVKALGKRGYAPTVRRDGSDAFLHVQVGPFVSRAEAKVMQQKLLGDGYNAILK